MNNYQLRTGISLADSVCVTDNDIGDEGSQALFGGFKNYTVFSALSLSSTIPKRTTSSFTWIVFVLTFSGYQRRTNEFGRYLRRSRIYLFQKT